ncbi:MAG: glycerophosphodiester phosphodiesterase, partial [Williamsia herbipolensis]|nr:glycerophosphodiester phosphodiesterase [Williamsia herbipolensis]
MSLPSRPMTSPLRAVGTAFCVVAGLIVVPTSAPAVVPHAAVVQDAAAAPPAAVAPRAAAADTATPIVQESFDGASLPAGFTAVEGTWSVRDGRLVGNSASSAQLSRITFGEHLRDFRFEVTVRVDSAQNAARWAAMGLDVPTDGATPWAIGTIRTGSTASNGLEFAQRTTSNTWNVTDTGSAATAAGVGRDVRIAAEVHGADATWFVDGEPRLRTKRLARGTGGQALLVNGVTVGFDDLVVTPLPRPSLIRAAGAPLLVMAHRGSSSQAPENTLVSDEAARRAGADFIENDVQPSKDGTPTVIHDATVDRTTDGTGAVRSLTDGQIAALDAGSWFAPQYTGATVPTFAAQLGDVAARGGQILVEIKGPHTRAEVARVLQDIDAAGMRDRVFVQSFEVDALRYTHELDPELPIGLLRSTLDADPVALSRELGLTSYNPSAAALATRPAVTDELHAAGVALMVWTVDAPADWSRLYDAGVDAVITNRPADLAGWNAARTAPPATHRPTVAVSSPGATLDRAQRPIVTVDADKASTVMVTLDGAPVPVGGALDL